MLFSNATFAESFYSESSQKIDKTLKEFWKKVEISSERWVSTAFIITF